MDMKSLIDYGTNLTFYLGIIFIVVAALIYVRKRINDIDAKTNSMFDIISTMAREIQYLKSATSEGSSQGMNLETALHSDNMTKDVLMKQFQMNDNDSEMSESDDESDDESDNESGDSDDESDDSEDESEDESEDNDEGEQNLKNVVLTPTPNINDIDEDTVEDTVEETNETSNETIDESVSIGDQEEQEDDEKEEDDVDEDDEESNHDAVKVIDFNESNIIDSELNDIELLDYDKMTTKELKEQVSTKGLATEVSKLKRQQLIKLLRK